MANDNSGWGNAAGAAITTVGNYAVATASNRRQFKYQKEALKIQDQYNRDLWDYQNAYNTPQAQMDRLRAAGLNPRLMYGSGGAATGNAGPIQSAEVPTQQAATAVLPDFMGKYLSARQADAQYQATTQNIESMKKRAALNEVQTSLENLKLMREQMRSKNYRDLAQAELDTQKFVALRSGELFSNEKTKGNLMDQLGQMREKQMTSIDLDNAFKQNRNALAKLGIYSSDNALLRILIQASNRMGINLDELVAKGAKELMYLLK